jgi:hypothetical protein
MLRRCGALVVAVAAVAGATTACSGSSSGPPASAPSFVTPSTAVCPSPTKAPPPNWPAAVPNDLPKPPNARLLGLAQTTTDGVHILKFTTPMSLRDSVLFVVQKLPKAGYVLGRGDAEAAEADAPFIHGPTRGLVRLLEIGLCQTEWLLATVNTQSPTGTPLLPPHTPSGSPSPLPFG